MEQIEEQRGETLLRRVWSNEPFGTKKSRNSIFIPNSVVSSSRALSGQRDAELQWLIQPHVLRKQNSRLLTHKNSPMVYCTFNLYRKDFCSYISLPGCMFRRLLKQCHILSQKQKNIYIYINTQSSYILLVSCKLLEHLKCPCFQRLRVEKLKYHIKLTVLEFWGMLTGKIICKSFFSFL